nr:PREDICTED: synaptotagmin-15 [Latimeria chalumnae]|eukprot:XP_005992468.1 PREDICTED: synaptotagmin-15 [Latimeria chalumnae]
MPVQLAAVLGGVIGGIIFGLLLGLAAYLLWKKRCLCDYYEELTSPATPTLANNSLQHKDQASPVLTTQQRTKSIPFIVPPKFHGQNWFNLENGERVQEDSEPYTAPEFHRLSFKSMGAYAVGTVNPDLYNFPEDDSEIDFPEGNIGRLWFVVEYEQEAERLLVSLIKARNLLSFSETCNPFVKIYLLPDERCHLQSKIKHKTKNPQFEERFIFQVSCKTLSQRTLKFSIYNVDKCKKHHLIGHVIFPLKDEFLSEDSKLVIWRDLEAENLEPPSEFGNLQFSLGYNEYLGRLTVVVLRAKGLRFQDEQTEINTYVKVSLINYNKFIKSKKTAVVHGTPNPVFNETFGFKLNQSQLDTASLSLSVYQNAEEESSHLRVVIGPYMYARGNELEHWNEMLNKPKELIKKWHVLSFST